MTTLVPDPDTGLSSASAENPTATSASNTSTLPNAPTTLGFSASIGLAVLPHLMWGFFPLFFKLLDPAGPVEVIVHRAVWGLFFCFALLAATHHLPRLWALCRQPKVLAALGIAGILIVINWSGYVYAIQTDRTTHAAIGYFFNPLMTVGLGMFFLQERLTRLQKIAVTLGLIAICILIAGLGYLPWISLVLPMSFAVYSLVKKQVANTVGPIEGMTLETAIVSPFLLGYLAYLAWHGQTSFQVIERTGGIGILPHLLLLITAGGLTVVPLILFAKAAQGLPLGIIGFIQYLSPMMQLGIGVFIFNEVMEPSRWVAVGIVWVASILLTVDLIRMGRRNRKLLRAAK